MSTIIVKTVASIIRMAARLHEPVALLDDHYRATAPFIWIGLMVALIAVSSGMQGVWF